MAATNGKSSGKSPVRIGPDKSDPESQEGEKDGKV
jgi:hypothetical protein